MTEHGGTGLRQDPRQAGTPPAEGAQSTRQSATRVLLTSAQAAREIFGIGERTFHALRDEEWMPQPVVLGPRLVRWVRSELEEAVQGMPRSKRATAEPEHLRRARAVA